MGQLLLTVIWYVKRLIQFLLLLPIAIPCWIVYLLPMWLVFRDLKFIGFPEFLVVEFRIRYEDIEPWFAKLWRDWAGHAGPGFYVYRIVDSEARTIRTRKHEMKHVHQQFSWGPLYYPAYFLSSVWIWLFQKSKHSYYHNYFEIAARRAAGQRIDIPSSYWKDGPEDKWIWWLYACIIWNFEGLL